MIMTDEQSAPINLILIDDEEDLVTFMAHRLRKRNMDVSTATSGAQALALAEKKIFHVAVVDLRMPDMDGITIIEKLRETQPFLQILMLTGHGSHDSAWEAGRLQAFRYLLKPYDFEDLAQLIIDAATMRSKTMKEEFEAKLDKLMTCTTSSREIIEESEKLRREYQQD
jgi:DNA-binding NtrC family response regulator